MIEGNVTIWDAINKVVEASGGDPSNTSVRRQVAVVDVHAALREVFQALTTQNEELRAALAAMTSLQQARLDGFDLACRVVEGFGPSQIPFDERGEETYNTGALDTVHGIEQALERARKKLLQQ